MELVLGKEEEVISPPKPLPSKLRIPSSVVITNPQVEEKQPVLDNLKQEPTSSLLNTPKDSVPAEGTPPASPEVADREAPQPVEVIPPTMAVVEDIPSSPLERPASSEVSPPPVEPSSEITSSNDAQEESLLPVNVEKVDK